ncbi:MAG: M1 family metallopeptidase [Bacteroidota bacterium]|nr:M1 family metallopeptidase [Bacteroidota bacterium]
MKHFLINIFSLTLFFNLNSQNLIEQSIWQQRVNHQIDVELFPQHRCIIGFSQITYFNHSPDTLLELHFHVWPNAYSNPKTAFAKQQLRNGNRDFHYSKDSSRGNIQQLDFKINNQSAVWHLDEINQDIAHIKLNQTLLPGDSIVISTPFKVRFPEVFSRMGMAGSFFSVTQWYPKPAVYDVNGWNTMTYLDQGEFYSEFGDYNVNITIPNNYFVASSGNLQNKEELSRLLSLKGKKLSGVNDGKRTLNYTEKNIHDFAWFADSVFYVDHSKVGLSSGDSIITWLFSNLDYNKMNGINSTHPIFFVNKGVKKYSELIGNYPYKQCTVVIGPLSAGAGMEYPTITICSSADEETIVHEIGHNWFYGILANNERKYPWMDESINTFFQNQIMDKYKTRNDFLNHLGFRQWLSLFNDQFVAQYNARNGNAQSLSLSSEEFTNSNYGNVIYVKGPLLFAFLKETLGDEVYDSCIRNYFETWKFRHPLPKDIQNSFEKTSKQDLSWFFVELLNENFEVDIVVKKGELIKVKGAPKLEAYYRNHPQLIYNQNGFLQEQKYYNNGQKKTFLKLSFPYKTPSNKAVLHFNVLPALGFNYYDKIYLGALVSNQNIFKRNVQLTGLTAYSVYAKRWVGYGQLNLLLLKNKRIFRSIESGIQGQSFGISAFGEDNQYSRINPYLKFNFKHSKFDMIKSGLDLNYYHTDLLDKGTPNSRFTNPYLFNYLKIKYHYEMLHAILPFNLSVYAENGYSHLSQFAQACYNKVGFIGEAKYNLNKRKKYYKVRVFAGAFLSSFGNVSRQSFYLSANTGRQDYLYEDVLLGRSEGYFDHNIFGQNLINRNGNVRTNLPLSGTDRWMVSMNQEITLPGKIPFNLYYDFGIFTIPTTTTNGIIYSSPTQFGVAGISIPILEDIFEIYYPFIYSKSIKDQYKDLNVLDARNIVIKLNLNIKQPLKKVIGF